MNKIVVGTLSWGTWTVYLVGADRSHEFGKKITLSNGEPLKISPRDRVYDFKMTPDSSRSFSMLELPSSVLEQARKGNQLFFTMNNTNYELTLAPSQRHGIPFDECVKQIDERLHNRSSMYEAIEDVEESWRGTEQWVRATSEEKPRSGRLL